MARRQITVDGCGATAHRPRAWRLRALIGASIDGTMMSKELVLAATSVGRCQ